RSIQLGDQVVGRRETRPGVFVQLAEVPVAREQPFAPAHHLGREDVRVRVDARAQSTLNAANTPSSAGSKPGRTRSARWARVAPRLPRGDTVWVTLPFSCSSRGSASGRRRKPSSLKSCFVATTALSYEPREAGASRGSDVHGTRPASSRGTAEGERTRGVGADGEADAAGTVGRVDRDGPDRQESRPADGDRRRASAERRGA